MQIEIITNITLVFDPITMSFLFPEGVRKIKRVDYKMQKVKKINRYCHEGRRMLFCKEKRIQKNDAHGKTANRTHSKIN